MAESPPPNEFEHLSLEVLKVLGKTLSQMNLYTASHPAVRAMISETAVMLSKILEQTAEKEASYTLDGDKLIANGKVVGAVTQVPNSIPNIFARFKLSSSHLPPGVTGERLSPLPTAALRPEAAKGVEPKAYLKEKGVEHIVLNESVYARVDKRGLGRGPGPGMGPGPGGGGGPGTEGGGGGGGPGGATSEAAALAERVRTESLDSTIEELVSRSVPNPEDQKLIIDAVLSRVRAELAEKVKEATQDLHKDVTVLKNEAVRTDAVLTNMADGVVVVDDQGRVLMMNPAAEELYGVQLAQVAGKPLSDHIKDEHLLTMAKDATVSAEGTFTPQLEVKANEDARRTLRASTAVVQTESGKTIGMVSAISDAAKHRELDRKEREFIAHVTHELRAPLTAIRAALEILDGAIIGKIGQEEQRIMGNALRNTDRLEDLISSILDFSKIESGQMTVHPKPISAEKLAQEAVESIKPWAMKKGVRLEFQTEPSLQPVLADQKRTVQVMVNLLSNAIKFTPREGRIVVSLAGKPKLVQFSVSDTGPGIAKEDQEKVFQKFVQIAAGEKHPGGTGLGLAIAQSLILLQQGTMWIESEVGKGATFLFTLPEYVAQGEEAQAQAPAPLPWWKKLLGLK